MAERLRVRTDVGTSKTYTAMPGLPVSIAVPPGQTSGLRVERAGNSQRELAIAEVQIPGVDVDRTLVLPRVPAQWGAPDSILLSSTDGWREPCVDVGDDVRCAAGRGGVGEEPGALDRTVRLGTGASYAVSASATPVNGDALQGQIQRGQLVNARASSSAVDDARGSAIAAIDGDPGTTWVADPKDTSPTLSVSWLADANGALRAGDARPPDCGREGDAGRARLSRRQPVGRVAERRDRTRSDRSVPVGSTSASWTSSAPPTGLRTARRRRSGSA